MAVVKKAQSISNITKKKEAKSVSVQSVRQPSIVSEMGDTSFGDLDVTKDGQIVSYDSTTNKFVLITADDLLGVSADDGDIPNEFVTTLEQELDLGQITDVSFDGGGF